jgi:hypothetical protein
MIDALSLMALHTGEATPRKRIARSESNHDMSWDISRRSVLGAAGAVVATAGASMAVSSCSREEESAPQNDANELASIARAPQRNPLRGTVLVHDTFDDGFNGWRDHYDGRGPSTALSLTSYPVFSGSHALMVGCAAAPDDGYTDGWAPAAAAAIKNLSRYYDARLVTFSCYLTHGSDDSTASLGGYFLMIDTQSWDDSRRSLFKLQISRKASSGSRTLSIIGDDDKWVDVYSGTDFVAGDNENKFNFDWLSLTVDLDANEGAGGYHSCQVNKRTFDLAKLSAGSAKEPPQRGKTIDSFAGGLNFGVAVFPGPPGSGESFIVIDQAMVTVDEAAG